MASYSIPRSSTSTWIIMQNNQSSSLHKNNWILLLIFLVIFIFIVILFIIIRVFAYYVMHPRRAVADTLHANHVRPTSSMRLDARAIASLPTIVYHSGNENDNSEKQCMVCLSVVKEGEMMKMLPNCKHSFHVKCIDIWLYSHPTCPICRAEVKLWRREGDGRLLASPMMPERVGEMKGEELSMIGVTVKEGSSMLRMESSFCRSLSMGRREGKMANVVVDLERQ